MSRKKKVFIGVLVAPFALAALLAVTGLLFLSSQWHVERSALVAAEPAAVFELVETADGWAAWTAWAKEDDPSHSIVAKDGPVRGEGMTLRYDSEKWGGATFVVTKSASPERLDYRMTLDAHELPLDGAFVLAAEEGGTRVTWSEKGDMGSNPLYRWMALACRGMVEEHFDKGLASIKRLAENPAERADRDGAAPAPAAGEGS